MEHGGIQSSKKRLSIAWFHCLVQSSRDSTVNLSFVPEKKKLLKVEYVLVRKFCLYPLWLSKYNILDYIFPELLLNQFIRGFGHHQVIECCSNDAFFSCWGKCMCR